MRKTRKDIMCVDVSVLAKWFLPEEGEAAASKLWERFVGGTILWLPASWLAELGSVVAQKVTSGALTLDEADEVVKAATGMPAASVELSRVLRRAVFMATELGISVWEAMYLATAEAAEATFYTADAELYEQIKERFSAMELVR
jgi:predicted nucleic acid-binding protein